MWFRQYCHEFLFPFIKVEESVKSLGGCNHANGATFCASAPYMFIWNFLAAICTIHRVVLSLAATEYLCFLFPVDDDKFRAITSSLSNSNTRRPRLWPIHPASAALQLIYLFVSYVIFDSATSLPFSQCKWDGLDWNVLECVIGSAQNLPFPTVHIKGQ